MSIPRRALVRGLGVGILGAGALSGCLPGRGGSGEETAAPTPGALTDRVPEGALRIGSIGTSVGPAAQYEKQIAAAIAMAVHEINYDGGVFGRDVELLERHVADSADEDLGHVARELADEGASAVVISVDDGQLIEHLPAIAATGMAMLSPTSCSTRVRTEGEDAGLLIRLAPTQEAVAGALVEEAMGLDPRERGGEPGTIAFVGTEDEASTNLRDRLRVQGRPQGAELVLDEHYDGDEIPEIGKLVAAIVKKKPVMLVLTGGAETTTLLRALHEELADEHGQPRLDIAVRLGTAAALDHHGEDLPSKTFSAVQAMQGGGQIPKDVELMMLNVDPSLSEKGPAAMGPATQAYDAVALIALGAQQALSLEGATIAGAIPDVLTGDEECPAIEDCVRLLANSLQVEEVGSIAYGLASGDLTLGSGDPVAGELRRFGFEDDGTMKPAESDSFDLTT